MVSDYQKEFPDFFLQSHTTVAPVHRFQRDTKALDHVREKVDSYLVLNGLDQGLPVFSASELFHMMPFKRRLGKQIPVKDILLKMQSQDREGAGAAVGYDAGSEVPKTAEQLQEMLKNVKMKSLKFGEDVRPPYQGTFTRPVTQRVANKVSRNPFSRALPNINYDYDSEAEWEEPEEGEELDSEEEEDASEDGDDDMEGFLDDEEDPMKDSGGKRPVVGDLQPICSGLCWEENGVNPKLRAYKMETIWESVTFPIDPFSSDYWQQQVPNNTTPGRMIIHHGHGGYPLMSTTMDETRMQQATGKIKRVLPAEQMGEFKQAVEGSDLTKAGLIDILKKR